ncbi:hypothetical protein OGAPHI_003160 [Ogataea philodendri]|uniref:Uncharacterized protein n=1 Tax=Ogataea philodendri TaxID=1378263 RepID=A0A9P8P9B7_9ASCO|nr:uncharacterized protein OGAPHI_003160 [Ogataea philodendri]KAH3667511.1 hypothetical protein OGAPHI_003160 [Ogataea philodendri]
MNSVHCSIESTQASMSSSELRCRPSLKLMSELPLTPRSCPGVRTWNRFCVSRSKSSRCDSDCSRFDFASFTVGFEYFFLMRDILTITCWNDEGVKAGSMGSTAGSVLMMLARPYVSKASTITRLAHKPRDMEEVPVLSPSLTAVSIMSFSNEYITPVFPNPCKVISRILNA